MKYLSDSLGSQELIAVTIVVIIFSIPVILNMAFGGGDIRYGVFCALFVGLEGLGVFVLVAGVLHLLLLAILKKRSFPFAPTMSVAALITYMVLGIV